MAAPFSVSPNAGRPLSSGVPAGRLRMWRSGQAMTADEWRVYCLLTDRPKPIRGYGGWTTIRRPGRRSVSTFDGSETPAYSIAVRIDATRPHRAPVADTMRNLERLCGWNRADDAPPPVVQWVANVQHDAAAAPQNEWVCETLEWGDSLSDDGATLLWADATVVLGLYVETTIADAAHATAFARHTLKAGETLHDFARVYLGDAKRWRDVADLNRDNPRCPSTPTFKARKAVVLLVPPRQPKSKKAKRGAR